MKRILSVTAALLLLLALAGCGSDAEPADGETAQASESTEPADASAEPSSLEALVDQMVSETGLTDAMHVGEEALVNVYGLDSALIADVSAVNASSGGAFPQEIVVARAVDSDAAAAIAAAFTHRLDEIAAQAESYDPDSLALAQKCQVVTQGDYVGLFFSEHYDQLVELFQNGIR